MHHISFSAVDWQQQTSVHRAPLVTRCQLHDTTTTATADGYQVLTNGRDDSVKIFDIRTFKEICCFRRGRPPPAAAGLHPKTAAPLLL